jgi:hypothetical protein
LAINRFNDGSLVDIDEELDLLDENIRRLKIMYDVYFGGGARKPPLDTEWKVQAVIKRYFDKQDLNYAQRFRYTTLAQKYSVFGNLWSQKLKIKEDGYRRPQDALLSVQGMRTEEEHKAAAALKAEAALWPFVIQFAQVDSEPSQVRKLFHRMLEARREAGSPMPSPSFDSFQAFIKQKTEQIRRDFKCKCVEFTIDIQNHKVRLRAKAKD